MSIMNMRKVGLVGTCSNYIDWKTKRQLNLFSQVELKHFLMLRWRDDVVEINEHVPISDEDIQAIQKEARQNNISTSIRKKEFTFVLELINGRKTGVCVVNNKNQLSNKEIESLWIKKQYCICNNMDFQLLDKNDINDTLVKNIRLVVEFYDRSSVFDQTSAIKYLIANKMLSVEMNTKILNFRELLPAAERMITNE